jgi:hypothetical protein
MSDPTVVSNGEAPDYWDDPRVLSAARDYADEQGQPDNFEDASFMGREAMMAGITKVYGLEAALQWAKS